MPNDLLAPRKSSRWSAIPKLLTVKEAAEALRISERTLWKISHPRGNLPTIRIGVTVRYDAADLAEWLEQKKKGRSNDCDD